LVGAVQKYIILIPNGHHALHIGPLREVCEQYHYQYYLEFRDW